MGCAGRCEVSGRLGWGLVSYGVEMVACGRHLSRKQLLAMAPRKAEERASPDGRAGGAQAGRIRRRHVAARAAALPGTRQAGVIGCGVLWGAGAGVPLTFLVYGDSRSNARRHRAVVAGMTGWTESLPAFVVSTGDLTNHGREYDGWNEQFFGPAAPLLASVPIVPVFGNHDSLDESWYAWFALPGNESWYSMRAGDVEIFVLSAYARLRRRSEQTEWLEGALAASDVPWKIVAVHQPLRTCASSRSRQEAAESMGDILTPVLEAGGVRLVLSGHDHFYGRSRDIDGFRVVTCAGGGAGLYSVRGAAADEACAKAHHFCVADVTSESLRMRAFDTDGELLDDFQMSREPAPAAGDEGGSGAVIAAGAGLEDEEEEEGEGEGEEMDEEE